MRTRLLLVTCVTMAVTLPLALLATNVSGATANARTSPRKHHAPNGSYSVSVVLSGASLSHTVGASTEVLTQPDDLTSLGHDLFVAFQNKVGPSGEPSSSGNTNSTVVEFTPRGSVVRQWDLSGHVDGLTADPAHRRVIVTSNEDGNSSLFAISAEPRLSGVVTHYLYNENRSRTAVGPTPSRSIAAKFS